MQSFSSQRPVQKIGVTEIRQRKFRGPADFPAMAALVRAFPDDPLHRIDLPYRLGSWALDNPENVGLWVDPAGELQAWVVMQTPFWTIDYACHPALTREAFLALLSWAWHRARRIAGTPYGRPLWFVNIFADHAARLRELEAAGFVSQTDADDEPWSKVLMARPAHLPVAEPALPPGFVIRPLAGEREVEACVTLHRAAFESRNMTVAWRARTLCHPDYIPELDLVAVAPDGRLVGFCLGWLDRHAAEASGQIEPLGVRGEFRRQGLGKALLAAAVQRFQGYGAHSIYVETDRYRNAAFGLYESNGFRVVRDVWVYRKNLSMGEE